MSLLCSKSKIIKAENVICKGEKFLQNNKSKQNKEEEKSIDQDEVFIKREEELKLQLIEVENRCQEIIKSAEEESLKIIKDSRSEALDIEKKAYEEGHTQGVQNGYEDGYKEAYEDNIEKSKEEGEVIIKNANDILIDANKYVVSYMKENKENILKLSINIAEQVLREQFSDVSSMDNILINIIEEYNLKENFVIKVNYIYKESLDVQIQTLKEEHKLNGDVFVLADNSIEQGNAVIDNIKGRLIIGIDSVLDKIKEELL